MLLEIGDHLARLHRRGGTNDYVMRNGLGARGIDYVAKTQSSTTTVGFPLYDAHGNNVATLSRNGSGGFNVNDRRAYDAWGVIRQGNTTGDPKGRYCANLGHVQDDESGLVYMRARYYEPTNGRFISEDAVKDGCNWFTYCLSNPVQYVDEAGNETSVECAKKWWDRIVAGGVGIFWIRGVVDLTVMWGALLIAPFTIGATRQMYISAAVEYAQSACLNFAIAFSGASKFAGVGLIAALVKYNSKFKETVEIVVRGMAEGSESQAAKAALALGAYSLIVLAAVLYTNIAAWG